MRNIIKIFGFLRPYLPPYCIGITIYSAQAFLFSAFSSALMGAIAHVIIEGYASDIFRMAGVFLGILAVIALLIGIGTYMYTVSTAKATRDLKAKLFRTFTNSSLEHSQSEHSGEGIVAINTAADTASRVYENSLSAVLSYLILIVASAGVVFGIHFKLGFASLAVGFLSLIIQSKFARPLGKIEESSLEEKADSVKSFSGIMAGGLTIRAFNAQDWSLMNFDIQNKKILSLTLRRAFFSMWQDLFTTVQGWMSLCVTFALGGWLVANGQLDFGLMMVVPGMCLALGSGMSGIGMAWAGIQAPIVASRRVLKILETGNTQQKGGDSRIDEKSGYKINIKGLNFRYYDANENALTNVNLSIEENEMVAFVGASGSGKSTLLRVIVGMYNRPDLGISLGNADFADCSLISWREKFAYVDQSCKLFDTTVSENIAFGLKGEASFEVISKSAIRAAADKFIRELPEGYSSLCGEQGSSLSGGQKQRIAIARALCKKAPILVFDEATAALDTQSEQEIMETISELRKDHTILLTTHNLQHAASADKIVVLEHGVIVECGTHQELINLAGIYASFCESSQIKNLESV